MINSFGYIVSLLFAWGVHVFSYINESSWVPLIALSAFNEQLVVA